MLKRAVLLPLIALLLAASQPASAIDVADFGTIRSEGSATLTLDIDNDSLLLNRVDGFYTSGVHIGQRVDLHRGDAVDSVGWRVGQDLYTASDINLPPALVGLPDHPYAAWLFGGIYRQQARVDGSRWKVGLDLGCLGPCAGGAWFQTHLHRLIRQPEPQGWSKQMRNEFGAVLYGDVTPVRWQFGSAVDLAPSVQGRIGNIFADAGASLLLRAGQLNVLPDQPTLHGFLRAEARAVAYNATLQGGYFSTGNPHTVAPKRRVAEAEAGVVWLRAPFSASVAVLRRGNEIRDLPNSAGTQNIVRLVFGYTM